MFRGTSSAPRSSLPRGKQKTVRARPANESGGIQEKKVDRFLASLGGAPSAPIRRTGSKHRRPIGGARHLAALAASHQEMQDF